ncbi:hypothetical protein CPC08DRAFT_226732 [Agrocybe pediades]|nr:hypothetical protein CPC08DRAFT_226732 [Agrocybe pediades]
MFTSSSILESFLGGSDVFDTDADRGRNDFNTTTSSCGTSSNLSQKRWRRRDCRPWKEEGRSDDRSGRGAGAATGTTRDVGNLI